MEPQDIPRQVRYDFYLTLMGTIIMFYVGYIWINKLPEQPNDTMLFFLAVGYAIFILGILDLREDFAMDYNLKRLRYEVEQHDLLKELGKRKIQKNKIPLMRLREK